VADNATEIPLLGGTANRGLVTRKGHTVRRPWELTSPAKHALLEHLAAVGFDGAPRYLGRDRQGREVLSYIPGEAVTPPYPSWALTTEALVSVTQLMSRYHEAVRGFRPPALEWPPPPPEPFQGELICHNDPNLDNVVFRDGRAVALIDFDLASPGDPLWDVAALARLWCPVRPDEFVDDARRGHVLHRLRTVVQAYDPSRVDPERLVTAVAMNHDWLYAVVSSGAEAGRPGFVDYWYRAADRVEATRQWYVENRRRLIDALL
jgi:hypothetical protein